eukprot:1719679-Prymnesium_polylepis.1
MPTSSPARLIAANVTTITPYSARCTLARERSNQSTSRSTAMNVSTAPKKSCRAGGGATLTRRQ